MPQMSAATDPACPPHDGSELALGIGAKRADADPVPPPRDGRKIPKFCVLRDTRDKDFSDKRHSIDEETHANRGYVGYAWRP